MIIVTPLGKIHYKPAITFLDLYGYTVMEKLVKHIEQKIKIEKKELVKEHHTWYSSEMTYAVSTQEIKVLLFLADTDDISLILGSDNNEQNILLFKKLIEKIISE